MKEKKPTAAGKSSFELMTEQYIDLNPERK